MPWFKVDDKLHDHRKARAAGVRAMGVWVLAGSWCMDHLMDGFVPAAILPRWGTAADARRLVECGLWITSEKDGERGWQFKDWHEFQPSRAEVEADRAATRQRVQRWRESRRNGVTDAVTNGVSTASPSRPVPTRPLTVVTRSSQSPPQQIADDGLDRIRQAIGSGCTKAHASKSAAFVLAKAPSDVRNPVGYVLAAIADDPDAYRYRRGNPTRETECPDHAGEWVDACRQHALERRLGGSA